jgi:thiol-disulfide isomerase/thioredoxin
LPDSKKIVIEVMYKASYCLPCVYMDESVREILPEYEKYIEYRRIDFMKSPGRERFLEISCELFGKAAVYQKGRLAPVPSLFIDGELFFDAIPPMFELREAIEEGLIKKGLKSGGVSS